jgi:hypothetical protein
VHHPRSTRVTHLWVDWTTRNSKCQGMAGRWDMVSGIHWRLATDCVVARSSQSWLAGMAGGRGREEGAWPGRWNCFACCCGPVRLSGGVANGE